MRYDKRKSELHSLSAAHGALLLRALNPHNQYADHIAYRYYMHGHGYLHSPQIERPACLKLLLNYGYKKVNAVAALLRRNYYLVFPFLASWFFLTIATEHGVVGAIVRKMNFCTKYDVALGCAVRFAPALVTELRNVDELVFSASAWRCGAKRQAALDGLCPGGRYNMCLGVEASDNGGQSSATEKEHISRRGAHLTIDFCRLDSYHKNDVFLYYNLPFKKGQ